MSNWGDRAWEHIDNARIEHERSVKETLGATPTQVDILEALIGIGYALLDIGDALNGDQE